MSAAAAFALARSAGALSCPSLIQSLDSTCARPPFPTMYVLYVLIVCTYHAYVYGHTPYVCPVSLASEGFQLFRDGTLPSSARSNACSMALYPAASMAALSWSSMEYKNVARSNSDIAAKRSGTGIWSWAFQKATAMASSFS